MRRSNRDPRKYHTQRKRPENQESPLQADFAEAKPSSGQRPTGASGVGARDGKTTGFLSFAFR